MSELLAELAEEFCRELQEGRDPSAEDYAARHPDLAERIRELFPALQALHRAGGSYAKAARDLTERFGPELDPRVTLAPEEDPGGDFETAVLKRLEERECSFDRYEIRGEVGRGGQGAVLAVWDTDLRRSLAMKIVAGKQGTRTGTGTDSRSLGRFLEEAHVTAQLDHPGIVPVHELGLDALGRAYFTMKLVKGRSLWAIYELVEKAEEGWTRTRALGVLLKVCEAMAYAHSKGVMHRDLKPSNIMVGKFGEVYVMDWGLARVSGRKDEKDLRVDPEVSEILSPRGGEGDLESPLLTRDGDVVGTPAYMSPEQARGELASMGPQSDVYAVGAMVYQLLSGEPPYVPTGSHMTNRAVWALVQQGPPASVASRAADVPPELEALCEKAMAREPHKRYTDMSALAEDLRAYLERRVVRAYETGAVAELRKWMGRNKGLAGSMAAGLLAVMTGLVVSWLLKAQSDAFADEVLRLAAAQELADLKREADELWPPMPEYAERYRHWLDRADLLVAGLQSDRETGDPGHLQRIERLESRALAATAEQAQSDRRRNPLSLEAEALRARLASYESARAVRAGGEPMPFELEEEVGASSAAELITRALPLVEPRRSIFGREAEGLALARAAVDRVEDDESLARATVLVAWALFGTGQDEEAQQTIAEGVAFAEESMRQELDSEKAELQQAIREARGPQNAEAVARLEARLEETEDQLATSRYWRFADERDRWWHTQLVELVDEIGRFADPETGLVGGTSLQYGWGIRQRLEWAERIETETLTGEPARERWAAALASIADPEECPEYGGLVIEPQLGLLPIGRDPRSGLWEFAHVLTGTEAEQSQAGGLALTEATGLVLVLVPGGSFFMGGQSQNPRGRNYDPETRRVDGPPHLVTLPPFFLSKYEMTQAQWLRQTGANPSLYRPVSPSAGNSDMDRWIAAFEVTSLHPVEQVSWNDAALVCERTGLRLPSEARWEYAARGGTDTTWWTGNDRESLREKNAANLADQSAANVGFIWDSIPDWPDLNDGYAVHAPAHAFAPNPFGLHNVHGNVEEWCQDVFETWYGRSPQWDPLFEASDIDLRVIRGGGFSGAATYTRSNLRGNKTSGTTNETTGLRPARAITGEIRYVGEGK